MSQSTTTNSPQFILRNKAKKLLHHANEKRKSGLFNDFSIQVGNEEIPCNKMVLSCYSTYFEAMFRTDMQERYKNTVELKEFEAKFIKMLIDHMYGEDIPINKDNVLQILKAADYLQMQDAKNFCVNCFHRSLTIENCLDFLATCKLDLPNLWLKDVYQFISMNFAAVSQLEQFMSLSKTELHSLLGNHGRKSMQQNLVFLAIARWIMYSPASRKRHFQYLFQSVDLSIIAFEFLTNVISTDPLVQEHIVCSNAVVKELSTRQKSLNDDFEIVCFDNSSQVTSIYSIFGKTIYPDLPAELSSYSVEKVDNFIYCIGGVDESKTYSPVASVYRMNVKDQDKKWFECASMIRERYCHASCVYKGNIVVSGGFCNYKIRSNSVEMYETATNKWKVLHPMIQARSDHQMAVCNEKLYAIGGNGSSRVSSVEKLLELESEWEPVKPLNSRRLYFAAISLNGEIFVIGDRYDINSDAELSVEKFVPTENIWLFVSDMNLASTVACVFQNKIFVLGFNDGAEFPTLECYDPVNDTWKIVNNRIDIQDFNKLVVL